MPSPSQSPPFIIPFSLDGHVALYHAIHSLRQFRGPSCSSARSPLLLLIDLLNICHDRGGSSLNLCLTWILRGFAILNVCSFPGICRVATPIKFCLVDFVIMRYAIVRHAPTNARSSGEGQTRELCEVIKSIDSRSLSNFFLTSQLGVINTGLVISGGEKKTIASLERNPCLRAKRGILPSTPKQNLPSRVTRS